MSLDFAGLVPQRRRVLKQLGRILLIIALLGATGGHWAVLQTIAWTDMLASNLQTQSLGDAITTTFDGAHPCKLCHQITEGKRAEKQPDSPLQIKKLEFVTERPLIVLSAPRNFESLHETILDFTSLVHRPTVPPPRLPIA